MIAAPAAAAIWHDLECGAYNADLPLWTQLARESAAPVLELGCGTGRVALHLAAADAEVTALDRDRALLAALTERATAGDFSITTVNADAREFTLQQRFGLICAPMQLAHLLGPGERRSMLRSVAGHLRSGGRAAFALLADLAPSDTEPPPPLPDVAERDGWVYSSQPLDVAAVPGGFEVPRLRQLVSPAGELESELHVVHLAELTPEALAAEAAEVGLVEAERLEVPPTPDHVGSVVTVLEAG